MVDESLNGSQFNANDMFNVLDPIKTRPLFIDNSENGGLTTGLDNVVADGMDYNVIHGNNNDNRIEVISDGEKTGYTNIIDSKGGDDVLIGAKGRDELKGGLGYDTYSFFSNHGHDIIEEVNNTSAPISMGKIDLGDIDPASVVYKRVLNDLHIQTGDDSSITVRNYFIDTSGVSGSVDKYQNDLQIGSSVIGGTFAKIEDVIRPLKIHKVIYGTYKSETIEILTGNGLFSSDENVGYEVHSGSGTDTIYGRHEFDTYVYNQGDGNDTIVDYGTSSYVTDNSGDVLKLADIHSSEINKLKFSLDGNDLLIKFDDNTGDSIRIVNSMVENILFSDGKKVFIKRGSNNELSGDHINGLARNELLLGFDGNDSLVAKGGSDFLIGGQGNDTLEGGTGSDTYIYNIGDGSDTIFDYDTSSNIDTLVINNINEDDIGKIRHITNRAGDLILYIGSESITIKNHFASDGGVKPNEIEKISFNGNEAIDLNDWI